MALSVPGAERKLTAAEQEEICLAIEAAKGEYKKLRAKLQAEAAIKANRLPNHADKASPDYLHCQRKQITPRIKLLFQGW